MTLGRVAEALPRAIKLVGWPKLVIIIIFFFFFFFFYSYLFAIYGMGSPCLMTGALSLFWRLVRL